jgi:hypothetical protein
VKIYLLGAEQPTNLRLMHEAGAKNVGLSYHSLHPRLPKKKEWLVAEKFDDRMSVYIASGGHSAAKKLSAEGISQYVTAFEAFIENNAGNLDLVTEFDGPLSPIERTTHRLKMVAMLGEKFVPVWSADSGPRGLDVLAESYKVIAVPGADAKDNRALASKMMPLTNRLGTQWHALDGARPDDMLPGRFASAATAGWLSPMRYGETIVWDGTRMVRYQARMKDQARRRHRSTFRQAGFDAEAILGDNHEEISRFTVWSYARLEDAVSRRKPSVSTSFSDAPDATPVVEEDISTLAVWNEDGNDAEPTPDAVDSSLPVVRNSAQLPARRTERETMPVFGFETKTSTEHDDAGNQILVERNLLRRSDVPLRQCDTCHLAATCPAFQPATECAYRLPIEIKTKEQMLAVNYAMLEMQVERIAFMRMAEEQSGGYADPNLSLELDRLRQMQLDIKKIEDNAEYIKINMEARGGAGVLSRLLGETASKHKEMAQVIQQPALEQYLDAEVLES